MNTTVLFKKLTFLFCVALLSSAAAFSQSGAELIFTNPVLVSGTANQQGAVYKFSNVTTGVDAKIKIKKFSRNDIVMSTIDNSTYGYNKAFQPEFGLAGTVPSLQDWYIDFEMTFYNAGTNNKRTMDSIVLTALDVDGDNQSIQEYVVYNKPSSITYSVINSLTTASAGYIGQVQLCAADAISSALASCGNCGGDGLTNSGNGNNNNECQSCEGSGRLHSQCNHAYMGSVGTKVIGPVTNFTNIDTNGTSVMSTYRYYNKSKIAFTYGAKTGSLSSSAGIRLNSTWFKQFNLVPMSTLPVKLTSFTATLNRNNKADLKWTTESEINTNHFVVERSTDGSNYSDAGIVFAYGNPADKTDYIFSNDLTGVSAPIVYYRLRSVDVDGKGQYSETRMIRLSKQSANDISIVTFPNPVTNEVRISIPNEWQNKKVSYEILNANGQVTQRTEVASSSQTESITTSTLSRGFYVVRVICEGQVAQQKIVKQ